MLVRVAIHAREEDKGIGALVLADTLREAVVTGEAAASRLVVLDAVDEEAARFYARTASFLDTVDP